MNVSQRLSEKSEVITNYDAIKVIGKTSTHKPYKLNMQPATPILI